MKQYSFYFILFATLIFGVMAFSFTPTTVLAVDTQCSDKKDNDGDLKIDVTGLGTAQPDPDCTSGEDDSEAPVTDLSFGIENPLESDIDTLPKFINRVVEIFLMIATPIVALMIIYAGFLFVIARGNAEAIEKAKKTLGFTLLGAAILLGAFVISTAIQDTITTISDESTTPTP